MKSNAFARRFFVVILPVMIIIGVVGLVMVMAALQPEPERTEEEPRGLAVFVELAETGSVNLAVRTQGEVRPRTEIDLAPQVSGRIVYVAPSFNGGGFFEENEPLFRIDDADYRLAVTRASAQVTQAQRALDLELAEAEIARRDWAEIGEGDPSALTLREPQVADARAQLAAARAGYEDARLQLSRAEIVAPFSGRVREKYADIGQYVTPGQRLGQIFATHVVEVRLPLSDDELALLNLPVAFEESEDNRGPAVELFGVVAGAPHTWRGRITRTGGAIDARTRTLDAIAEVEDPYGAGADNGAPLAVGMFVDASIEGRLVADAVSLPRGSLRGADQVYVAHEDGTLEIRAVGVITSERDRVVLGWGVETGEYVITSTVLAATPGMKIEAYDPDGTLLFPPREDESDEDEGEEADGENDETEVAAGEGDQS